MNLANTAKPAKPLDPLLEQALKLDPNYAPGLLRPRRRLHGRSSSAGEEAVVKEKEFAQRARFTRTAACKRMFPSPPPSPALLIGGTPKLNSARNRTKS